MWGMSFKHRTCLYFAKKTTHTGNGSKTTPNPHKYSMNMVAKGEGYMFDKYGEFDSYIAINEAVRNQLVQGDDTAVIEIYAENGLDKGDAEDLIDAWHDYLEEDMLNVSGEDYFFDTNKPLLCNALSAALGKFEIEKADLGKCQGEMNDYLEYVEYLITTDEVFRLKYREPGKNLVDAFLELLEKSSMYDLPEKLTKKFKGEVKCGDGRAEICRKLRNYYVGGTADD